MSFWQKDFLQNYVPFVDVTVPETVCQIEAVFLRVLRNGSTRATLPQPEFHEFTRVFNDGLA